jgi:hypothetical protein
MSKIRQVLRQADAARGRRPQGVVESNVNCVEPAKRVTSVEEDIPFIEVGWPRSDLEASPSVQAARRTVSLKFPALPDEPAARSMESIHDDPPTLVADDTAPPSAATQPRYAITERIVFVGLMIQLPENNP